MQHVIYTLMLTAVIEAVTCLLRFEFDMQSTRDTGWVARFTGGLRVHHGYVGVVMLLSCPLLAVGPVYSMMLIGGAAMVVSDMVHHYAVLWPTTGRPQFHIVYPGSRLARVRVRSGEPLR